MCVLRSHGISIILGGQRGRRAMRSTDRSKEEEKFRKQNGVRVPEKTI